MILSLSTLNFNQFFALDWLLIIVFLVIALFYGLALGKNRMLAVMLAAYISFILIKTVPWKELKFLGQGALPPSSATQIFIFLGIILALLFFSSRSWLGLALKIKHRGEAGWVQLFIFATIELGLLSNIVLSFLPAKNVKELPSLINQIFTGDLAQFLWLLLPIAAMLIFRKEE